MTKAGAAAPLLAVAQAAGHARPVAAGASDGEAGGVIALQDRLRFELQPLLRGVQLLANSLRVLRVVREVAGVSPGFNAELRTFCPDWSDPLAGAGNVSPDAVLADLAHVAAELGQDLAGIDAEGGAA